MFDKMDTASRVNWPSLRGKIRRNDPDAGSPDPYFPNLSGTTLTISEFGDNAAIYTINFTSNAYGLALDAINTTAPAHLLASDDNGYIRVTNLHGGNRNGIVILPSAGVDASTILGFDLAPSPFAFSYAGEVLTAPTGWPTQSNRQGSKLISRDEGLSSYALNRPILDILNFCNINFGELDKEIAVPVAFDVSVVNGVFSISDLTKRLYTASSGVVAANPGPATIEKFITILNTDNTQVFANNSRVRVSTVTYGTAVNANQSFANWTVADGKSVFGNGVWGLSKTTATISDIAGNILYAPGALFESRFCTPNDTVVISSATNLTPFSHNGEFVIDEVIDQNRIAIRPKHPEDVLNVGSQTPSSLNLNKQVGENYGTVTIPVGKFIGCGMPAADMVFSLSPAPPNGTYRVILPIGRTLRQIFTQDLTISTIPQPSGGQIELGSKLQSAADAEKPRIIIDASPNNALTLIAQMPVSSGFPLRLYVSTDGAFQITHNAKWSLGIGYTKDTANEPAYSFSVRNNLAAFYSRKETDNAAWLFWDEVASLPRNNNTISDLVKISNGLSLGETIINTQNEAKIPRLTYKVNPTEYTLLNSYMRGTSGIDEYATPRGLASVYNAKWDGTQWIKDINAQPSVKLLQERLGLSQYIYGALDGSFSETDWTSKDELLNYAICDDFIEAIPSVNTNDTDITTMWKTGTLLNSQFSSGSGGDSMLGAITARASAGGNFNANFKLRNSFKRLEEKDIILKIRTEVLVANDISNYFIGVKDEQGGLLTMVMGARCNGTQWFLRTGDPLGVITDTLLGPCLANTAHTITIARLGSTVYGYLDDQFANSVALNYSFNNTSIYFDLTGFAAAAAFEVHLDYLKFWCGRK